ncbi:MAG TPA: hypothetical protein VF584_26855, partial [Longimicrobium sp.]
MFTRGAPRSVAERRAAALADAATELREDLRVLMRVTSPTPPERGRLGDACRALASWAQNAGYGASAVHFAEAGAAVEPEDAAAAFVAARTNRVAGEGWRAELYYIRAIR